LAYMTWWQRFRKSSAHTQANIVCSFVIMIATVIYSAFAGCQLKEIKATNELTKQAMHVSSRAWVGIESAVPNRLDKTGQGQALVVSFTIKNYGHSAAQNVRIFPEMSVLGVSGGPDTCNDSNAGQYIGDVILPDQKREFPWSVTITNADIEASLKKMNPALGRYLAGFIVHGCLEYIDDPAEKTFHHTPFSYVVSRQMGKEGMSAPEGFISPETPHIDGDKLAIEAMSIYTGKVD
jgi:hypothetical protein